MAVQAGKAAWQGQADSHCPLKRPSGAYKHPQVVAVMHSACLPYSTTGQTRLQRACLATKNSWIPSQVSSQCRCRMPLGLLFVQSPAVKSCLKGWQSHSNISNPNSLKSSSHVIIVVYTKRCRNRERLHYSTYRFTFRSMTSSQNLIERLIISNKCHHVHKQVQKSWESLHYQTYRNITNGC